MTRFAGLALTLSAAGLTAGCGPATDDAPPGEMSANEAPALNDAASVLGNDGDAVVITNAETGAGNVE